jgi:hypothetical protein
MAAWSLGIAFFVGLPREKRVVVIGDHDTA